MKDLRELSDAQLDALDEDLRTQKRAIRDQQNAVEAERGLRRAMASMPDEARRILSLRLDGGIAPAGEAIMEG